MKAVYAKFRCLTKDFGFSLIVLLSVAVTQAILEFLLIISLVFVLNVFAAWVTGKDTDLDIEMAALGLDSISLATGSNTIVVLFMTCVVFSGAARVGFIVLSNRLVAQLSESLSRRILVAMLKSDYSSIINYQKSNLVSSVTKKVDVTVGLFVMPCVLICNNLMVLFGITISLIVVDVMVTIQLFASLVLLYFFITMVFHRRIVRDGNAISIGADKIVTFVEEVIGGIREVYLYGSRNEVLRTFSDHLTRFYTAQANIQVWAAIPRPLIEALAMLLISTVGLVIANFYSSDTDGLLPLLGALIFGLQRMLPLAQQVYSNLTVIKGSSPTAHDLIELESSFGEQLELESNQRQILEWNPSKIELKNISFNYLNHPPVLKNVSITLDGPDQFIAVTGDSGSGKSTLVDILAGLLYPSEGIVEIGSRVLARQNRLSWRNRVVYVQQSPFISSSTIAENIAFQTTALDQDKINYCIDLCDLRGLVASLTDGFSTRIGLGGRNLSNGQKQRIAIARAIYRDFDLLILDEALNGIDPLSVCKIMSAIKSQLRPNQKLILVSHVPTHFELADLVIKVTPRQLFKITNQG